MVFKQLYYSHLKLDKRMKILAFVALKVCFGGSREAPLPHNRTELPNSISCCVSDFTAALWALYYHSNFFTSLNLLYVLTAASWQKQPQVA